MENHAVRKSLTERYDKIRDRLARVTRDGRHSGKLDADFAEQAAERENDEVLATLDTDMRTEMGRIEKALARLDSGKYGRCETCGKPIPSKRLNALPYATDCVQCESRLN